MMSKGGKTSSSMSPALEAALMDNVNYANQVASRPFQPYAGPFDANSYLSANPDLQQAYQTYLQDFQMQAAAPPAPTWAPTWAPTTRDGGLGGMRTTTPAAGAATPATPLSQADFARQHYLDTGYLEGRSGGGEARPRVAGFTPDQQAGFDIARALAGTGADLLRNGFGHGVAQGVAGNAAGYNPLENGFGHGVAQSVAGYEVGQIKDADLSPYMNPFQQSVIDATTGTINRQNQIALNNVGSQALSQGAYGGSRQGVAQADTNRGYADTLASTVAGLNRDNFNQAQQAAAQDIDFGLQGQQLRLGAANQMMQSAQARNDAFTQNQQLQLAAADQMMGSAQARNDALLSQQAYDANRANLLLGTGGQQQANRQAVLDAQYQEFLRAAGYPVETLQIRQIPFSGTLPQQSYTPGAGIGGTLQGLGSIAGGAAALIPLLSDRRAKTDIRRIGTADNGLGVYAYRYRAGGPMRIGFMADEVERLRPEAVVEIGGMRHVRYDLATEAV